MDASDGANKNGNGHADPAPVSLPSAAAAPSGAPVSSASPAPAAGAPEPLVVVDDDARDPVTGKIRPGKTLNKKGRPPGTPNVNDELIKAVKSFKLGQRKYLDLLLTKSLQDIEYAKLIVPKILANVDQPVPAGGINIHNTPTANATQIESYGNARKLLADEPGRELLAGLAERLASGSVDSGTPRHVRQ